MYVDKVYTALNTQSLDSTEVRPFLLLPLLKNVFSGNLQMGDKFSFSL
jgi:hypothetical protein